MQQNGNKGFSIYMYRMLVPNNNNVLSGWIINRRLLSFISTTHNVVLHIFTIAFLLFSAEYGKEKEKFFHIKIL